MSAISFVIEDGPRFAFSPARLIIAGWAGRDSAEVEHHIAELAALGVKRPATTPCFYEVAASLLTVDERIDVVGGNSSGEVEAVLVSDASHGLLVGVGSDHTDRKAESYDVAVSKQMCAKPLGATLWRYDDVAAHWDQLIARSWRIDPHGERVLYQEGSLARLLPPAILLTGLGHTRSLPSGTVLYCGTQALLGALLPAWSFEIELHDPVLRRTLVHRYGVNALAHVE
ncbi:DUF2848 domain-containing protein [Caballeronia sp. LP006]|jgi:hypothetical protein|uniref:DUF2848 domain-containing protein n=1 Tax=unclassified Caballeronia TaxID=2646786 RepID=UPI002028BF01|nr:MULTISPECIES: DUF2848 domain-containing protein [unclassified Caballeronia]MDR5773293.1 DUF2848 domain-containing protein [Caballeronia sp. LZ002]MDR5806067.1 DUF2848 domain-containing protein [Caballeronia sp. LZ001]MDR5826520.1 DUF2848 domain-containing protein [Caballeronia sp. LP006]MDR5848727.1 DUF2848 domain-containing protein [Caballeronia sp. LZ003]